VSREIPAAIRLPVDVGVSAWSGRSGVVKRDWNRWHCCIGTPLTVIAYELPPRSCGPPEPLDPPPLVAFAIYPAALPLGSSLSVVTSAFTFLTARGLAHHPKDGFVNRLHSLRFLHECDSSYRGLTFPPVGLFPLNTSAFSLDIRVEDFHLQVGARRGRVHSARNFWRARRHCCRLSMIEFDSYGRLQSGALCPSPSLTSVAAVHCLVASSP
jgi:hypothetical protein